MKNIFTEYLLKNGWYEESPMSYKKNGAKYEIFFDNSNQIEIYENGKRIGESRLSELNELVNLLNTLGGETSGATSANL